MRFRKWRCFRRRGYLLLECLLVMFLFAGALSVALPTVWDWQQERELDMAAAELAAAIREAEVLAKNSDQQYGQLVSFNLGTNPAGRVEYYTSRSTIRVPPQGVFSENITAGKELALLFRSDGFAGQGEDYSTALSTRDKKHVTEIVVAAYTGRVRVHKVK